MERAVAYARFSSDNQRDESIDAQLRAINKYAEANGYDIIGEYIDRAKTGTNADRDQFQKMIFDSESNEFTAVIVHKLDRFARNRYDSAISKKKLKSNGVRVISVLEHLDSTPESIIMEGLLESMSEYYSANLSREVMKGMKENALACKHTGGKPPLGYRVNSEKRYEIDEDEAYNVRYIFDSIVEGKGYSEIIKTLNERGCTTRRGKPFGKNSLYEILKNEKYVGVYVYNRCASKDYRGKRNNHSAKSNVDVIRKEGGVPAIISKSTFDAVQEILLKRKQAPEQRKSAIETYLLTGKIRCGVCGNTYCGNRQHFKRSDKLYVTYRCNTRSSKGASVCDNKEINRDTIEHYVLKLLADVLFDDERIPMVIAEYNRKVNSQFDENEAEYAALKKTAKKLKKEIGNLVAVIAGTGSTALLEALNCKEKEHAAIKQKLDDLKKAETVVDVDKAVIENAFKQGRKLLLSGEIPHLRQLVNLYVDSVEVYPDTVTVTLNVLNGLQANADDEGIDKLLNSDGNGLAVQSTVSRREIWEER